MEHGGVVAGIPAVVAAAHELKSPLVLMRQLALSLQDQSLSDRERSRIHAQLVVVSDRSLRLTTDLTRSSQLNPGLLPLEPINAERLCEDVVNQLAPLYRAYGRKLRLKAKRTRLLVVAHPGLLESIIYHFSDNALYYGDDGGSSDVVVSLQHRRRTNRLRIGVRDKGPAMSLSEWRTAKAGARGGLSSRPLASGIGLYIAERFSEAMSGTIGLIRHRDGATFYVDIPISEQMTLL